MRTIVLVHGVGSGPWVFDDWPSSFPELNVSAVDLHAGLEIERATMSDYASQVESWSDSLQGPVAICGWSMGGLVALMAAAKSRCAKLVLIEGSAPGEVQGFDSSIEPRIAVFDSEEVYGAFPSRLESQFARDERKRGISVPSLPCPTLVISGKNHPVDRGSELAEFYGARLDPFPDLDHWQLLTSDSVKRSIREFLGL